MLAQKKHRSTQEASTGLAMSRQTESAGSHMHPVLNLQRTIGNHAVQRLLHAKLLHAKAVTPTPAPPDSVKFNDQGEWEGETVLSTLKARTSVPPKMEEAIQGGAKATISFCNSLSNVVNEATAEDPEKAAYWSDIARRLFLLTVKLDCPKIGNVLYQDLANLAQWYIEIGQAFRDRLLAKAEDDVRLGRPVLENISNPDVTSCIDFARLMAGKATGKDEVNVGAYFKGPNVFKEVNPNPQEATRSLADIGAWHGLWDGDTYQQTTDRPRPGDFIIIFKGRQFQHISILQAIEPHKEEGVPPYKEKEIWRAIGGGKEPKVGGKRMPAPPAPETYIFDPLTGKVNQGLRLHGWIDTAALYRAAQSSKVKK